MSAPSDEHAPRRHVRVVGNLATCYRGRCRPPSTVAPDPGDAATHRLLHPRSADVSDTLDVNPPLLREVTGCDAFAVSSDLVSLLHLT